MKLDRYVFRELVVPFIIGTIAVSLMFEANLLIYFFKTFSMALVPAAAILKLLLYKTPYFLNLTLPVGIALAASLATSRLTRESEITAMRASGASVRRIMFPIAVFGLFVGGLNFLLAEYVEPAAEIAATKLTAQLTVIGLAPEFRSDVALHVGNFWVTIGSVYRGDNGSLQLNDVMLVEKPQIGAVAVYRAPTGTYSNGVWKFPNAEGIHWEGEQVDAFKAGEMTIYQKTNIEDVFAPSQPTEKTMAELRKDIADQQAIHADTRLLETSYYNRISVPAACFVFAVVAPVFAVWLGRGGGFVGILLSIFMVLLYYNAYVISSEIFGQKGWFTPFVAAWAPDVLFFLLGLLALRRLE